MRSYVCEGCGNVQQFIVEGDDAVPETGRRRWTGPGETEARVPRACPFCGGANWRDLGEGYKEG